MRWQIGVGGRAILVLLGSATDSFLGNARGVKMDEYDVVHGDANPQVR